ncbi:DUF2897 family protein [Vibrio sp. Of7-15]|uniref:DUF2897 family protein n=1 Tax=Vibrio sp. Of7-15 TaxID=2724879 RepID=UPI001EF1C542|nr:DUF2897 family protein [Vibrio sp. Of7-15]MCG7498436.1 DUF2897 family protein [Vibrio sp. Of7-15]
MEFLTNPWVIIVVVLSVVIGNIAALKYTANMKFGQMDKKRKSDAQSEEEGKPEDSEHKTK